MMAPRECGCVGGGGVCGIATWLWLAIVVVVYAALVSGVRGVRGGNPDAKRLYDDLLSNYNKLVRPVVNNTDALTVKIKIKLSQLIDVNLKNQIMTTNLWVEQFWQDYKLSWDPKEYGGVEMLHVPSDHIWRPDIVLYNNADGNFEVTLTTKAILHFDGRVEWKPPAIYKSSCEINVEYFPFDEQRCVMKFGSWTYSGFQVDLRHMNEVENSDLVQFGVDLSEFYMSVEWDILEVPAIRHTKFYTCCLEPYVDITFQISMRRKTLFYTVNLIIPCMFISFLTVLVFYLPSDSGEKVTLSISILLSLTVFFLLLAEIIPPTSIAVPLLGKYLLFTMILVTLSICVTVVVLNVHFRSPTTHTMSPWVRRVFIHILPRLLVMRRPQSQPQSRQKFLVRTCNGVELRESYHHLGGMPSPLPPPPHISAHHHSDVTMDTLSGRQTASSPHRDCCIHGDGCSQVFQASSVHHHHQRHHHQPPPPPPPHSQRTGCTRSYTGGARTVHQHDVPTSSSSFNENLSLGLVDDATTATCRIHGPINIPTSDDYGGTLPISLEDIDERNGAQAAGPMFSPVHCCRSSIHGHHCPEVYKAVEGVRYITEHVKREQDSLKVKEDWKYVAMVLDRLFLWIFTVACVVGTCGIILQAPTLYDKRAPIEYHLSDIATTVAKPDKRQ